MTQALPPADTQVPRIDGNELIRLITENISRGNWPEPPTFDPGTGTIHINHTPEVHKQVEELLNGFRASMDIIVTVEARFLIVEENFLEDIGVDLKGLQGAPALPNALQAVPLDGGAGFTALTSGVYGLYQNNTRELRARVEHTLNSDQLFSRFSDLVFSPVSPTLSYNLNIGTTQLQAILTALSKRQRGKLLQAPKITAYNGQRAYVSIFDQFTYIRDYDIVVSAPPNVTADPVLAVLTLGTIIEVKPIVSADLKYITMEVRPAMTSLTPPYTLPNLRQLHPQVINPGSVAIGPSEPYFELPDIQYQTAHTTVVVPDGGTILIGGYMTGQSIAGTSEVPILSKIPIIGALFRQKPTAEQRQVSLILIRAYITVLGQEEKEKF
jgi:type II secretory pathway component GspD/PulD (secretin)